MRSGAPSISRARAIRILAVCSLLWCFGVVVLGAYVRLSSSGLGCPDWPGCYGHWVVTSSSANIEVGKAWREMAHRYAAGMLGLMIVSLVFVRVAWRQRLLPLSQVIGLLSIVMVQGLLGRLTVTWQLKPLVVTLHLLLGCTTLSLLLWIVLSVFRGEKKLPPIDARRSTVARLAAAVGLLAVGCQIVLGGWTSSNYAATACPDFPTCQGQWWPESDFKKGFALALRGPVAASTARPQINYEGGVLATPARTAIHLTHRLSAIVTTVVLLVASILSLQLRELKSRAAVMVLVALKLQLIVGISMVLAGFPLWLATLHNAAAALLLMATVALNFALSSLPTVRSPRTVQAPP